MIARQYRKYSHKISAGKREYFYSIYLPGDQKNKVELIGNFSRPAWGVYYKLQYNKFYKSFHTIVKMKEGSQFKFLVNGNYEVSSDYPIIYVISFFIN